MVVLLNRLKETMYKKAFCKTLPTLLLLYKECDCSAMSMRGYNMNSDPLEYHLGHHGPLFKFSVLAVFREQLDSH